MSNASGTATVWNCPNYVGELFLVGQNQTPFLNAIGGLNPGQQVQSWEFPIDQQYALETAAQPAITETASLTAPTATTYVRSQVKNVCQIFQKSVSISYAKQSNANTLSGLALDGMGQPVRNEKDFQIQAALKQIALDAEYTFINGTYNLAANAGQANKTRGMLAAITTNSVDASAATLSKTLFDSLVKSMVDSGAQFQNMYCFVNSFQKQKLSNIYGYAPEDRAVGGTNIQTIYTDFATIKVVYCPQVPAAQLLLADLSVIAPVFLPVPGKGYLFYEDLAKTGASETGQLYGQMGLNHGVETFHGKLINLATA